MTAVGSCSSAARLRGQIEANSIKDSTVVISDLAGVENVKTYNGTTFQSLATSASDFKAKYAIIHNERAVFLNCKQGGTSYPHLLVASARDAFGTITVGNRPSSSLGVGDAFFLPTPNLKPGKGLIDALGRLVLGTLEGNFYQLNGIDSKDHSLDILYAAAGSSSDEGQVFAGNDIIYSRLGAIEALSGSDQFGDIDADDLSRQIKDKVKNIAGFTLVYSPRFKKIYAIPEAGGTIYVLHKSFLDENVRRRKTGQAPLGSSPWSIWTTDHSFNFEPTAAMRMLHPAGGLEYMFMGSRDGKLYQVESGAGGDPSSTDIEAIRVSPVFSVPPGKILKVNGTLWHRKIFSHTATLTFEYGGREVFDSSTISVSMAAATNAPVFGGTVYF